MANLYNVDSPINREQRNNINDTFEDIQKQIGSVVLRASDAKDTANALQEQLNTIVINGDSSVEAAQARVGEDGTIYPTLKNRIDSENLILKEDISTKITKLFVDVTDFGAVSDGVTDSTTQIQQAVNFAVQEKNNGNKVTIVFPLGDGFIVNSGISIPANIDVIMDSILILDNLSYVGSILTVGSTNEQTLKGIYKLKATSKDIRNWDEPLNVSVEVKNVSSSEIEILEASSSSVGFKLHGDTRASAYNNITLNYLADNQNSLLCYSKAPTGYVNENLFLGGRFSCSSRSPVNKDRFGIVLDSDYSYKSNNNVFLKPCFELNQANAGTKNAIPIKIVHGSYNTFKNCRSEGNSTQISVMVTDFLSILNEADFVLYGSSSNKVSSLNPSSFFATYKYASSPNFLKGISKNIRNFNIRGNSETLGDGAVKFGELNVIRNNSGGAISDQIPSTDATLYDDYVEITGGYGLCINLSTEKNKRFFISSDTLQGFPGRVFIKAYDSSGNLISTARSVMNVSADYSYFPTSAGGSYAEGSDNESGSRFFSVSEDVYRVVVGIRGGTTNLKLRGFSINTVDEFYSSTWK